MHLQWVVEREVKAAQSSAAHQRLGQALQQVVRQVEVEQGVWEEGLAPRQAGYQVVMQVEVRKPPQLIHLEASARQCQHTGVRGFAINGILGMLNCSGPLPSAPGLRRTHGGVFIRGLGSISPLLHIYTPFLTSSAIAGMHWSRACKVVSQVTIY